MDVVRKLARAGKTADAEELGKLWGVESKKSGAFVYKQLFTDSSFRKHLIFLSLAFLANWMGCQVFLVLGTTIMTEGKGMAFPSAIVMLVLANGLSYIGYILHGRIGDWIGRRETIIGGWIIAGIMYTLLLFSAQTNTAMVAFYSAGLFFLIGTYSALFTYMGESFPTRVRGTAAAWVNAMGPVGAIVGSAVLGSLMKLDPTASGYVTAAFWAGVIPIFASAVLLLGARRIRGGEVLEDIST